MAGNDQHGLGDQAKPALLHDGRGNRHGLASADGMGEVCRASRDNAPDAALLVPIKRKGAGGAWKLQVIPVESSGSDVVEAVVIDPRQPVGPVGIGPDPVLESGLDLLQLFLGGFRIHNIEHALFSRAVLHRIEDLRHPAVQRVGYELAGMTAIGAPFGRAGRHPSQLPRLDGPRCQLRHMMDRDLGTHRLLDEGGNIGSGNPWAPKTRGNVGRPKIGRLNHDQGTDIALEDGVECGSGFCGFELVADLTGEIGVGRLPGTGLGIPVNGVAEFGDDCFGIGVQQLGDVIDVDMAAFVEHDGKRIGSTCDDGCRGRRDDALGENRTRPGGIGFEIVVLNRGNQPAMGLVEEGLQVRSAMHFTDLARLGVLAGGNDGRVDGAEGAHKIRPGDAQLDLGRLPGPVELLGLQDFTHGITDGDQFADDPRMPFRHALARPALAHRDGHGNAIDHLDEGGIFCDEETALAHAGAFRQGIDGVGTGLGVVINLIINLGRLAVINGFRKEGDRCGERPLQIDTGMGQAGIGLAIRPRDGGMRAEHEIRVAREPAVDADGALICSCSPDLLSVEP